MTNGESQGPSQELSEEPSNELFKQLPAALQQNPELDQWLTFNTDETITLRTGKVELGQGIKTSLAMICAEELDVNLSKIRVLSGDSRDCPNEFMTAGSMSIEGSGSAIRQASAEVRFHLGQMAADLLAVPIEELALDNGEFSHVATNRSTSYWDLMVGRKFTRQATGQVLPKSAEQHRLVGTRVQRIDLLAKFSGQPVFIQDLQLPDMVHGRVLRPPGYLFSLKELNVEPIRALPGVLTVVVDGSFVGVVAETEIQAINALNKLQLSAHWQSQGTLPKPEDMHDFLLNNASVSLPVVDGMPIDAPVPDLLQTQDATNRISATYTKPFHMHGSIGPSAAVAQWCKEELRVWTHSQGPMVVRGALAQVLKIDAENIHVRHVENAGCYGHNGADDAALDACLLARSIPDRPVLLKWSREDEHSWEPYSPAMVLQMQADLDANGHITAWNHDTYSNSHMGRPIPFGSVSNFIAAGHLSDPMPKPEARPGMAPHGGIHRNADPYYDLPHKRIVKHLVQQAPIRTSSTRGLGAYGNVFAIESFMDELAEQAGVDPVDFRLQHLSDPRAIKVITSGSNAAAKARQSRAARAARAESLKDQLTGSGMAFARYKNKQCYAAVFVDLAVNTETSEIILLHTVITADAGQVIDPDGLSNQLEGGFVQSASWTLKEQVTFDENGITSKDWENYPILTFPEVPTVDVILLDHPQEPSMGSGEATQGPASAAIANAVFDATGLRLRDIPFTPDKLRSAALKSR